MKKTYKSICFFAVLFVLTVVKLGAQPLSGNYTIDNTQATGGTNYNSFTAFATALNTNGVSGPVVVNVGGNMTYNEQPAFNQISGMSAANNVVINGNGRLLTFNASSSLPYTMLLNGTDYLTVNELKMQGTNSNYAMVCVLTGQANYNNFSACTFSCPANSTNSYHVPFMMSQTYQYPSGGGQPGNYNTVSTCTMYSGYWSVFAYGNYNTPYTRDNKFIGCQLTDFYQYAIYAPYHMNMTVKGCTFDQLTRTSSTSAIILAGDYMQGLMFDGNLIHKIFNANQSYTGSFYGIYYMYYNPSSQTNRNTIRNNIFRDIHFNGSIFAFYYCYYSDADFYHNTLSFDQVSNTSGGQTYGFYYCYSYSPYVNTFSNNLVSITRGGSGTKYAFYFGGNTGTSLVDYNNLYVNGAGGNNNVGYFTSNATTFAQWQSQGVDVNGSGINPVFQNIATGDLHPTAVSLNNKANPMGLLNDFKGAVRNQTTPDIGALEFLTPMCAGTPSNSLVGPSLVCPGKNATITVGNISSDAGITYQWQHSTTSNVGPWTPVSTATTPIYVATNVTTTTYYQAVIACTASNGGTATPVQTINVAGTTIENVPYYEGFEGIFGNNELPNCSWKAPTIGGPAYTFTSAGSNYRQPHTGTKFAAFGNLPTGTNYFYTNGINLNAGITYSAALWYLTEPLYSYANWTDLSIMIGTSQTPNGLTTIVSSGNAAIAPQYKLLDNTFTVPASGVYYIVIKATSITGNAVYLSWDDLSITVPCNIAANKPGVNISTNNLNVCSGATVNLTANGADSYLWSSGQTSTVLIDIPLNTGNTPIVKQYSVTGTSNVSGCSSGTMTSITIKPGAQVNVTGMPALSCAGQVVNVTASGQGVGSYTWNTSANGPVLTVSPSASTSYTVLGSNSYNCVGTAVYVANVKPLPTVAASPNAANICAGETATFSGNGAATYMWSTPSINLTSNPVQLSGSSLGVVSVTLTGTDANGCSNTAYATMMVDACTGIAESGSINSLRVYPNPTSDAVTVELSAGTISELVVTDLAGRIIASEKAADTKATISLSSFAAGVYYVKVTSATGTDMIKVIKN